MRKRKTRKQNGGNMAEAQRLIDKWVMDGDVNKELDLSSLNLTSLPTLPKNLKSLNCYMNKLTKLPILPTNLTALTCFENNLTSLPSLPTNLEFINCCNNNLTSLPKLPNKLRVLTCGHNKLTSIPMLPNSLEIFYCKFNNLPEVYYPLDDDDEDDHVVYINRIRKLQKSRKNVLNSLKPHITEKKRNVFANTTFKNMPRNVVKKIANYIDEEDLENININSLKPKNVKRGETKKKY